ncbi:biotin transporter BioY [Parachlamydia acanthamoebae]|uniref:Biotin transporter n=1 Tax=Parachlamydia acanthamoebae TaxID=83552 RepID=A0A0C1BYZ8_9BACT|nr:biotin transporter BioY [Parachlamydia acanthamoebae]KIA76621.1 hypothetical protein DB43_AA00460 [Parachlamydia acanthamoebae]
MQTLAIRSTSFSNIQNVLQIIGCSLLLALSAQIAILLPFTPIPLTLQTLTALLIGARLGPVNGALAVVLYLIEIGFGCPFLAGGLASPTALFGLKGGYLMGMIVQAYIMGFFAANSRSSAHFFVGGCFACLAQLFCGASWFSLFFGWEKSILLGFVPFLPGEIIKVYLLTKLIKNK